MAELEERLAAVESPCRSRADRFQGNGDGTVTDTCMGLMWLRRTADTSGDGTVTNEDFIPFPAARDFCDALDFAGRSDWRLPTLGELADLSTGIVYRADAAPWSPMSPAFELHLSGGYWAANPSALSEGSAYQWAFHHGVPGPLHSATDAGSPAYVLAVRGP